TSRTRRAGSPSPWRRSWAGPPSPRRPDGSSCGTTPCAATAGTGHRAGLVGLDTDSFLVGAAFAAVGCFASALTDKQALAAALAFFCSSLLWLAEWPARNTAGVL